jgi:hypothetical protein
MWQCAEPEQQQESQGGEGGAREEQVLDQLRAVGPVQQIVEGGAGDRPGHGEGHRDADRGDGHVHPRRVRPSDGGDDSARGGEPQDDRADVQGHQRSRSDNRSCSVAAPPASGERVSM